MSFSASHAFHNRFGEWSKKISSPFVGTAAGPFNGRHFFSGKIPFFYFEQHFGRRKGIDGVFIGEKKGQILIRSIQFPKCQSLDFIYRTKKNTPAFFQSGADSKSSTSAHWRRELLIFRFRFSAWNDPLLTDVWTFQLIIAVDCNWIFPGKKVKVSTLNRPPLAETGGLGQLLDSV